jgi:hypothetical protein
MAAKKTTLNELGDMLTHVVKHMATKDDITRLDTRIDKLDAKIDSVESNLAAKINRLDTKLTKFEENEIDKRLQLEVRVSHIEKHLGTECAAQSVIEEGDLIGLRHGRLHFDRMGGPPRPAARSS